MHTGEQSIGLTITASAFPENSLVSFCGHRLPEWKHIRRSCSKEDVLQLPKTPQMGSLAAFLGRGTSLVCMEGHPGGRARVGV